MDVSGRIDPQGDWSASKGCDEDFEFECDPCSQDGNFVKASGYCMNCEDYLCLSCYKIHCKPTPLRNHVLLDQNRMPKQKPRRKSEQTCTEVCTEHQNEKVKFYCSGHDDIGCSDCLVLRHKNCDVDYIPSISEGYDSSLEYTILIQNLKDIQDIISTLSTNKEENAKEANVGIDKALTDIRQRRKYINMHLDRVEEMLADKCIEMKSFNQDKLKMVQNGLTLQTSKIVTMQTRLTSNLSMTADLFVRSKQSLSMIKEVMENVDSFENATFQTLNFKTVAEVTNATITNNIFGVLKEPDALDEISLNHHASFNVKGSKDRVCYITGIEELEVDRIACTDWANCTVKIVDINRYKIVDKISIDQPWDITVVSKDKLAVTCPNKRKIQFLDIKSVLTKCGTFRVDGMCRGIDCNGNSFAVSYLEPPKVEIINITGTVLKLIKTDVFGKQLFLAPFYVAFSRNGNSLYVSDDELHTIFKFSVDGRAMASCKNKGILNPRGLFVCKDGCVFVGSSTCTNVFAISADCKQVHTIFSDTSTHKTVCAIEDKNVMVLSNSQSTSKPIENEVGIYTIVRNEVNI